MSEARTRVDVHGAGPAGLVAAINLAMAGFEVHLFDQHGIGGNPDWHPSIQTTVLAPERTWRYIGIDLSPCFRQVRSITFYRHGRKKTFTLENMYACERGPREGSLDSYLYEKATQVGVVFHPSTVLDADRLDSSRNTIVATGLDTDVYRQLDVPSVPIIGYRGLKGAEPGVRLISYISECTNYDFAYLATARGLCFALLFSRRGLARESLDDFQQLLAQTEGIRFDEWTCSTGSIPTRTQLFHKGWVLAGTISGMIDPFLLHGISGALTSGRVAAQTFVDRDEALREFRWLARNFELKRRLKALSVRLPLKRITLPLMMLVDSRLRGVGFI